MWFIAYRHRPNQHNQQIYIWLYIYIWKWGLELQITETIFRLLAELAGAKKLD